MIYKKGTQVRTRSDVTSDMIRSTGSPGFFALGTATVEASDTGESGRVYYMLNHNNRDIEGRDWWLPGEYLERVNVCMFHKEDRHGV